MFTGIITDLGVLRTLEPGSGANDTRLVIGTAYDPATIEIGASIACSGPCLTAIDKGRDADGAWFAVEASAETLARTTMGSWRVGDRINLERALTASQELGGHIVTGHVDAVIPVISRTPEGASARFVFEVPQELAKFIAPKGSVALDGVSLTVNEVDGNRFGVNIIRHTQEVTSFGGLDAGMAVNLEVDLLARYVQRQLEAAQGHTT